MESKDEAFSFFSQRLSEKSMQRLSKPSFQVTLFGPRFCDAANSSTK
ncbi:hypothetical protein D932_02875 [Enterococcus casseliflavus 14-MB-W-14]|uniref:Uncharacterized protein n=1 Tax=Enterococcus casseliflavus ATCC 12755 TaxID=888066 RepID=F0EPM6_ENTCA|nr:hypothetical protein HMPREF9087_3368 [Enterococcus casseliflavus ATCC 12755]EPH61381.1 hypothetical protein D932_02875 [Enterococcus casseliflavus 14-MB-W-14]OJG29269.1 hypothetical protein RU99_GL001640 [Enterococcus casseliflavus]